MDVGTSFDPRWRVLIKNSLASILPFQLSSAHYTTHSVEGDGKKKVGVPSIPLVPSTTYVKKTACPWPAKHNENTVFKDTRSLTDITQLMCCVKTQSVPNRQNTNKYIYNNKQERDLHKKYAHNAPDHKWKSTSYAQSLIIKSASQLAHLRGSRIPILKTEGNPKGNRIPDIPTKDTVSHRS